MHAQKLQRDSVSQFSHACQYFSARDVSFFCNEHVADIDARENMRDQIRAHFAFKFRTVGHVGFSLSAHVEIEVHNALMIYKNSWTSW
jgi:hypothetical protein